MRDLLKKVPGVRRLSRFVRRTAEKLRVRPLLRELRRVKTADDLAVVIAMPGSLHIGALALDYLRGYKPVLCVANGLTTWELEALQAQKSAIIIRSPQLLQHSLVIDALVQVLDKPFWLVDHDCYMMDVAVLREERKRLGNHAGLTIYRTTNHVNGIVAPETFLLLLNPEVIRNLQKKYGVTSRIYSWEAIPPEAKNRLQAIGVNQARQPDEHKPYFDTLRVIALLAQADGCGFVNDRGYHGACQIYPECIHVGGTSQPLWPPPDRYYALGSYFWRRCLETSRIEGTRTEYGKKWPHVPDSKTMRQYIMNADFVLPGDSPELLDSLDALATQSLPRTLSPV